MFMHDLTHDINETVVSCVKYMAICWRWPWWTSGKVFLLLNFDNFQNRNVTASGMVSFDLIVYVSFRSPKLKLLI